MLRPRIVDKMDALQNDGFQVFLIHLDEEELLELPKEDQRMVVLVTWDNQQEFVTIHINPAQELYKEVALLDGRWLIFQAKDPQKKGPATYRVFTED